MHRDGANYLNLLLFHETQNVFFLSKRHTMYGELEEFTGFFTKPFVPTNYPGIYAILKNEGGI